MPRTKGSLNKKSLPAIRARASMIEPYELDSLDLQHLSAKVIRLEIEKELKRPEGCDRGMVIDWYIKLARVAEASPRRKVRKLPSAAHEQRRCLGSILPVLRRLAK
jgi:hypothetical protein